MTRYDSDLGDRDPGAGLRDSMGACVSDIRLPASLLDRAVSRDRKRKGRIRLTGAVGAMAVVAAAAVVIATVPGRTSGRSAAAGRPTATRPTTVLRAQDAAYVLDRAAAAQMNSYHLISVDQNRTGLVYTDVATQQQRSVSSVRDSSGVPYFQITDAVGGGAFTETDIEYQHHVYSTWTASSMDDGVRVTLSSYLPLQDNADPAVAFSEALKAGIITVAGHRNLNGRDTILIRVKSELSLKAKSPSVPPGTWLSPVPASLIWIDASTYLVVQTENFLPKFHPAPGSTTPWTSIIDQVTWLSPTPGNLALLTLTPPTGFTKIPYSEMAQKYLAPFS